MESLLGTNLCTSVDEVQEEDSLVGQSSVLVFLFGCSFFLDYTVFPFFSVELGNVLYIVLFVLSFLCGYLGGPHVFIRVYLSISQ